MNLKKYNQGYSYGSRRQKEEAPQKGMLDELQRSPETGLRQDTLDTERSVMKINNNRISYNFMTGEDYDKQPENGHLYVNKSDGVMDMFSAFSDAINKAPKKKPQSKYFQ